MSWESFRVDGLKVYKVPEDVMKAKVVRDIIAGPFILRFVNPDGKQSRLDGEVEPEYLYWVGSIEAYNRAKDKKPKRLKDLFDKMQKVLKAKIMTKTLGMVEAIRIAKHVFPDAQVRG